MKHKAITKILSLMVILFFSTASIGFAADSAVSGLGAVTTVGDSDLLLISYWTGSAFQSKKITFANFKTAVGTGSGTAGKVCKTITNPSDADNILFDIASARTITKISGICVGGTSAVITLQDAGADGSGSTSIDDAITMDTDGANGGTISYTIHDGDIIKLDVGTVTGVVTQLMVCYE